MLYFTLLFLAGSNGLPNLLKKMMTDRNIVDEKKCVDIM
jgi:hypothetical protein